MQKLLMVFVLGAVAGGILVVRWPHPSAQPGPQQSLEKQVEKSTAENRRLLDEIVLLKQERSAFRTDEAAVLLCAEEWDDVLPDSEADTDAFYLPAEPLESGRPTAAADQVFRERLINRADSIHALLENNPEESAARNYLRQARDVYLRAGHPYRAIEIQEELLQHYPEPDPYRPMVELASLKKAAGELDKAITILGEAVITTPDPVNKLNGLRRTARYKELRGGPQAGLAAWQELEQYAVSIGQGDSAPARKARKKIKQLESSLELQLQ